MQLGAANGLQQPIGVEFKGLPAAVEHGEHIFTRVESLEQRRVELLIPGSQRPELFAEWLDLLLWLEFGVEQEHVLLVLGAECWRREGAEGASHFTDRAWLVLRVALRSYFGEHVMDVLETEV